jgi:hypothetical protein
MAKQARSEHGQFWHTINSLSIITDVICQAAKQWSIQNQEQSRGVGVPAHSNKTAETLTALGKESDNSKQATKRKSALRDRKQQDGQNCIMRWTRKVASVREMRNARTFWAWKPQEPIWKKRA